MVFAFLVLTSAVICENAVAEVLNCEGEQPRWSAQLRENLVSVQDMTLSYSQNIERTVVKATLDGERRVYLAEGAIVAVADERRCVGTADEYEWQIVLQSEGATYFGCCWMEK